MINEIWAAVGSATFLPAEGKAHVGVRTICVGGIRRQDLLGGLSGGGAVRGYSRRRLGSRAGPGSLARVVVDVVRTPTRIESQLPPRWKIVTSRHGLCYRCRGGTRCRDGLLSWLTWMRYRIRMVGATLERRGFGIT
jgi:hypothetical protein